MSHKDSTQDFMKPKILINGFSPDEIANYVEHIDNIDMMYSNEQPLLVEIDTFGGSIYGLGMLYNKLKGLDRPIVTYCPSKAMSAGVIILSAVATPGYRFAAPTADIMIHEIQASALGDIKTIEDETMNIKKMNKKWMTILAKSIGLKTEQDIRKLIKQKSEGMDLQLDAKQAKKLNIIDDIAIIKMIPPQGIWEIKTK